MVQPVLPARCAAVAAVAAEPDVSSGNRRRSVPALVEGRAVPSVRRGVSRGHRSSRSGRIGTAQRVHEVPRMSRRLPDARHHLSLLAEVDKGEGSFAGGEREGSDATINRRETGCALRSGFAKGEERCGGRQGERKAGRSCALLGDVLVGRFGRAVAEPQISGFRCLLCLDISLL